MIIIMRTKNKVNFNMVKDVDGYVEERLNGGKITNLEVDFAIAIFQGMDAVSAVEQIYNFTNKNEVKRHAKKLLNSKKIKELLIDIRNKYTSNFVLGQNEIVARLEILYSEAIEAGNMKMQLEVLKEMSNVLSIGKTAGVNINMDEVKFELPAPPVKRNVEQDKNRFMPKEEEEFEIPIIIKLEEEDEDRG